MRDSMSILKEYIKKVKGKWCVFSHQTNKNFGCYDTKEKAQKRLAQIKAFSEGSELVSSMLERLGKIS